jgi:hypothetical protein
MDFTEPRQASKGLRTNQKNLRRQAAARTKRISKSGREQGVGRKLERDRGTERLNRSRFGCHQMPEFRNQEAMGNTGESSLR